MRVLLDTHLLLWALSAPAKLSAKTRRRIESSEVFVSAVSLWEISIKCALGKLEVDPAEVLSSIEPAGFDHLPMIAQHAVKIATLPQVHKDPFDRMLVAQASVEPMILLTDDEILRDYGPLVELV